MRVRASVGKLISIFKVVKTSFNKFEGMSY